jgi:YD repeat-containing protein
MIRKSFRLFFALMILQGVFSAAAAAQAGPACIFTMSIWSWEAPPFDVFGCIYVDVEGAVPCNLVTSSCPPPDAAPETCNGQCATNATATSPISLASGNTYIKETDVSIPGLGGGLSLVRTWNSLWPVTQSAYQIGLFGPNWRSNFEEQIFLGADHYVKYARGDGSFWSFGHNIDAGLLTWNVAAPANRSATLVMGSSNWVLTFQNGEQRIFGLTTGKLLAITDRNGNTTQLSYDSLNRLVTVTDAASRHLYFAYGGSTNLVTNVTSDFGEAVSYNYDGLSRLSQVTEPDASTLSFQYDSHSFISTVLDSNGKVLEAHTYDSTGRGLSGTRANGVDAVTISYPN